MRAYVSAFLLVLFCSMTVASQDDQCQLLQRQYTIGTEAIAFYPHFDFTETEQPGYGNQVLARFADYANIELVYIALPVRRLYHEIDRMVDAVYPDHPAWVTYQGTAPDRFFSARVATTLGTTFVQRDMAAISAGQVRTLAIIHGFTPVAWMPLLETLRLRVVDVPDAHSALGLLALRRVDAADVEYHVARHILSTMEPGTELSVAKNLPYIQSGYHLSSVKHPQLIRCFDQFLQESEPELIKLKQQFNLIEDMADLL